MLVNLVSLILMENHGMEMHTMLPQMLVTIYMLLTVLMHWMKILYFILNEFHPIQYR